MFAHRPGRLTLDRFEQFAVIRKGASRKIGPAKRLVEEAFKRPTNLFEQLPEHWILCRVIDRETKSEILAACVAVAEMDTLHHFELGCKRPQVVRAATPGGQTAGLDLEAPTHVERCSSRSRWLVALIVEGG